MLIPPPPPLSHDIAVPQNLFLILFSSHSICLCIILSIHQVSSINHAVDSQAMFLPHISPPPDPYILLLLNYLFQWFSDIFMPRTKPLTFSKILRIPKELLSMWVVSIDIYHYQWLKMRNFWNIYYFTYLILNKILIHLKIINPLGVNINFMKNSYILQNKTSGKSGIVLHCCKFLGGGAVGREVWLNRRQVDSHTYICIQSVVMCGFSWGRWRNPRPT